MNASRPFRCGLWTAALLGAISTGTAHADMLVLSAQADGQYDYGIELDANHGLVILAGDEITLSGLSGVTGASVLPDLAFAYSLGQISTTSATIVDTIPFVLDPLPVSHTISALRVTSSATTSGLADYTVQTGNGGVLSGKVLGPGAPVPEPAALPVIAGLTALLALIRVWKRRIDLRAYAGSQSRKRVHLNCWSTRIP